MHLMTSALTDKLQLSSCLWYFSSYHCPPAFKNKTKNKPLFNLYLSNMCCIPAICQTLLDPGANKHVSCFPGPYRLMVSTDTEQEKTHKKIIGYNL